MRTGLCGRTQGILVCAAVSNAPIPAALRMVGDRRRGMQHRIVIAPYDPHWPLEFRQLGTPLRAALGDLALRVDHIGSTSVPGLAAKDVIDVQITIKDFSCTPQLVAALGSLGYTRVSDITGDHLPPFYQ